MEFCPEIAVFNSAFQLVYKQTDSNLSGLSKDLSKQYMEIIKTAVDEICRGLEQDISGEEAETWNQRLHLMCLYSLIENSYREPIEKKTGRVPVCGTLDTIAGMLPKFSRHFYFEIVKTCSWTHLLIECLDYIDRSTATSLLSDLLNHSQCDPIDPDDTKVISMVTEKILASCLHLPVTMDTGISALLHPVRRQRRYVQIVYPDIEDGDEREGTRLDTKGCSSVRDEESSDVENAGLTFWDHFVEKNPELIVNILDHFEKCLGNEDQNESNGGDACVSMVINSIAKIFLCWYIHLIGSETQDSLSRNSWFVNNVYVLYNLNTANDIYSRERNTLSYSLNMSLIEKFRNIDFRERLIEIVKQSIELTCKCFSTDIKEGKSLSINDICLLKTRGESLYIKTTVLFRMVQRSLIDLSEGETNYCLTDLVSSDGSQHLSGSLILDDDWSKDITLDALLWRIENVFDSHDVCLQTLLSERCWSFWKHDRVYEVMKLSTSILSQKSHSLKLIQILTYLLQQPSCTTVQTMREVLCASFNEMSMLDKDMIVGLMYADDAVDMGMLLCNGDSQLVHLQITNTFNKVTADMDIQVLNEVFVLCLMEPLDVFKSALEMCVKNQDQALNFAKMLCNMPLTCTTKHPVHHPDKSLIVSAVEGFMREAKLTDKEEKHFNTFVRTLMKKNIKEHAMVVLPPTEFITSSLLEAVNFSNFSSTDYPIKCSFALSLLVTAFECGSNSSCDWSDCEFEPAVLIVNLAGILHECTELWGEEMAGDNITSSDSKADLTDNITHLSDNTSLSDNTGLSDIPFSCDEGSTLTTVSGHQKIAMKENVLTCLELVETLMVDGILGTPDNETIYWLLAVTEDLNCLVKVTLAKLLFKLGHIQPMTGWMLTFHEMTTNLRENLPVVMLLGVTDTRFIEEFDKTEGFPDIQYEDLISALVQIMPNLLKDELQEAMRMTELFIRKGLLSVCYRSTSHCALPLTDLSSVQPTLCISQILRDVILTLNIIQGEQSAILKHVLQCYVTVIKIKCGQDFRTEEVCLFTLSQIFHHGCDLAKTLPEDCVDNSLVLLLHLLTRFKDVVMEMTASNKKVKDKSREKVNDCGKLNLKLVKNFENAMLLSAERLSDSFEEKHMLVKKLLGPA